VDGQLVSMDEFNAVWDQARHSAGALLQASGGYSGHRVEETLQNFRMQRAVGLLQVLRHEVESPTSPPSAASPGFLEEVQVVAELALRRHSDSRDK